jgi:hypothetical protein
MDLQISQGDSPAIRQDAVTGSAAVASVFAPGSPTGNNGQFGTAMVTQFTFEPVPAVTIRASQVEVCWASRAEATHRVEWCSDLSNSVWTPLVDCVRSTGEWICVQDPVPSAPGGTRAFYRVVPTICQPE